MEIYSIKVNYKSTQHLVVGLRYAMKRPLRYNVNPQLGGSEPIPFAICLSIQLSEEAVREAR
jgi:hypothetical protein